ncbi:DUF6584 family protein [Cellulomonas phragmiteti]|uniref:Uncharacterized protein n=1 Tax=Cellulomonas phragmiteti TaxID=478780 RepID=A0ABQ4DP89_9CELL|nr:DUF6584 family protein [Cellulomonas phragmiteti]GIG40807.1 hypothetical protein Cph01nite_25690 [Cellulomonas phragmiteti]
MESERESIEPARDDAEELRRRRRRLKDRVRSAPWRLDLREELAAVYRAEGNASQAGRWSYLAEHVDPAELRAFARSCRDDPVEMMWALRWTGSEERAETELARERLLALRAQARARTGRSIPWEKPDATGMTWQLALGCFAVVLVLVLVVIGAVTAVRCLASQW